MGGPFWWGVVFVAVGLAMTGGRVLAQEDELTDLLKNAKPAASAPAPVPASMPAGGIPANSTQPAANDPLGTINEKPPIEARIGTVTLSTGKAYEGRIWTTIATPLRVWVEAEKTYRDVDWALVSRIEVHVLEAVMEDDWRWLKEGSDQKVYSGKKYPSISLAYKFTLVNGQTLEGTVVAPINVFDGQTEHHLALYKKYKGKLDETLQDVVYVKSISLHPPTAEMAAANEAKTTKLPLIEGGY